MSLYRVESPVALQGSSVLRNQDRWSRRRSIGTIMIVCLSFWMLLAVFVSML